MSKRVIEIERCDDCPYCEFYNGWNNRSDVVVCLELDKVISDDTNIGTEISVNCPLKEV